MSNSFYGNISITPGTSLYFDIVYSNRYTLKYNEKKDGIYLGRYALVEYNNNPIAGLKNKQEVSPAGNEGLLVYAEKNGNTVIYVVTSDGFKNVTEYETPAKDASAAELQKINYDVNLKIDQILSFVPQDEKIAQNYDSTAWQKIYISADNNLQAPIGEVYIEVARLNATMPPEVMELIYGPNFSVIDPDQKRVINPAETVSLQEIGDEPTKYRLNLAYRDGQSKYYFLLPIVESGSGQVTAYKWCPLFTETSSLIANAIMANQITATIANRSYLSSAPFNNKIITPSKSK